MPAATWRDVSKPRTPRHFGPRRRALSNHEGTSARSHESVRRRASRNATRFRISRLDPPRENNARAGKWFEIDNSTHQFGAGRTPINCNSRDLDSRIAQDDHRTIPSRVTSRHASCSTRSTVRPKRFFKRPRGKHSPPELNSTRVQSPPEESAGIRFGPSDHRLDTPRPRPKNRPRVLQRPSTNGLARNGCDSPLRPDFQISFGSLP